MDLVLHDYQEEDRDFLLSTPRAALIHLMGLGKTAITLSAICELMFNHFEIKHTLIVAPLNVATISWPGELTKWDQFKDLTWTVVHGPHKAHKLRTRKDIYIINYDGLRWLEAQYRTRKTRVGCPLFDLVVYDESTYVKKISSERWKISNRLFRNIPRVVELTGTPSPNGYLDLYGQMELLQKGMLAQTYTSYRNSYFVPPGSGTGKWQPRNGVRDIIAKKMAPFVKERGKEVLNRDEPTFNTIYCTLPAKLRGQYEELEEEFFLRLDSGEEVEAFNASSLSMKLRQFVSGFLYKPETKEALPIHQAKVNALKELIEALNGSPLLCAIQFRHEVDMLRSALGYNVPAIYGDTKKEDRIQLVQEWNQGLHPLFLINTKSVSHGLNMQEGGSNFLYYSQPWELDLYEQAIARIDRQGQKEAVIVHSLIIKDTIDEVMQDTLKNKNYMQKSLLKALRIYREEKTK